MRKLDDGRLVHSATDLLNFVECPHLTYLDLEVAEGRRDIKPNAHRLERPGRRQGRGARGRVRRVAAGRRQGGGHDRRRGRGGRAELEAAHQRTIDAMRDGAEVIYQSALYDGTLDRLRRLPRARRPALGPRLLELRGRRHEARAQGQAVLPAPALLLHRARDADPGHDPRADARRARHPGAGQLRAGRVRRLLPPRPQRYLGEIAAMSPTYPHSGDHCGLCRWSDHCDEQRVEDDHLSLVAWMRRDQIARLERGGITTMAGLAVADAARKPGRDDAGHLRQPAPARQSCRSSQRETGEHGYELLEPEEGRGFARLPAPSPGDLFFDMEGDPFFDERARVPVRRDVDRGRRAAVQGVLGRRPRRGEARVRASSSTSSPSAAASTPTCTSTTTRPTSRPR